MTIAEWLDQAANELADAMIPSARLDAEIILAHTLNQHRTWLHAHGESEIDPRRKDIADARVELRLERVPVAYIIGHKEFYGRRFYVTPDTLIPRPESETMITLLKTWLETHPDAKNLIDVGTGSGALGITAALEQPTLRVTLSDISQPALQVAARNAKIHDAPTKTLKSNLLDAYPLSPDIILANLPYVDRTWSTTPDTVHEPEMALFADDKGLALIKQLITQSRDQLADGGVLLLEADPRQHPQIEQFAKAAGFSQCQSTDFIAQLEG